MNYSQNLNSSNLLGQSQGANIITEAIERNISPNIDPKDKVELYLAGGAQVNFPTDRVKRIYDLRQREETPISVPNAAIGIMNLKFTPGTWYGDAGNLVYRTYLKLKDKVLSLGYNTTEIIPNRENYFQIHQNQTSEGKEFLKWGGKPPYNKRVNGEGHSWLQHLNALDYIEANPSEFVPKPETTDQVK